MQNYKQSMGTMIGNTMQFYDFTLYSLLAPQIQKVFFNVQNQYVSYLIVFGVFACGYLTRPLGSMLFGYLGDKKGRSYALSITIIVATVTTTSIGLLPGYDAMGTFSPIFLIILRLLQGIAVSGEEGCVVVLLFEKYAFKHQRLIGATILSSVLFGVLFGIMVCLLTEQFVSQKGMDSWGWRLPFLLALPLGTIATFLRFYLNDFKLFSLAEKNNLIQKQPIKSLFKEHSTRIIFGFLVVMAYSIPTSTIIVHIPYFLTIKLGYNHNNSLLVLTLAIVLMISLSPLFAKWLQKMDIFTIYQWSLLATIMIFPCLFYAFSLGNMIAIVSVIAIFAILVAIISSTIFSILAQSFPFGVRCSGVSFSFNLCITVFSSTTPVALIFIENHYTHPLVPALYLSSLLSCSLIVTYLLRKSHANNSFRNQNERVLYQT